MWFRLKPLKYGRREKECFNLGFPNIVVSIYSSDLGLWLGTVHVKFEISMKTVERKRNTELKLQ